MSMSPKDSPSGIELFPEKKLRVIKISKRGMALVFGGVVGSICILLVMVLSRGKSLHVSEAIAADKQAKAVSAAPPSDLLPLGGKQQSLSTKTATAWLRKGPNGQVEDETSPEIVKERAEYARDIRRYEHQRHMQRLTRGDSALLAEIEIKGGDNSGFQNARNDEKTEDETAASQATVQRLPNGQMALGSPSAAESFLTADRDPNLQGRKEAFSQSIKQGNSYLPYQKESPISPNEIKQGTVIPAIMISGINSDLPGQIIAQVSQNVYDTVTGNRLLIPQGTRLVGSYDSYVAVGQERAMVAWRRLIFPDGMALELLNMGGVDESGYAGFNDQVNNHYMKIFGSAILLSFVGAGYQMSQPQQRAGEPISSRDILASQMGQQLAQVSGELMRRNMQIQPTIEIRPGYRFNVMVNKDMILDPYEEN